MQASSVKKKLKSKGFAASINRDDIARGAADLGVDLDEHIQFVIGAMNDIVGELALSPGTPSPQ
jgi:predicted hydrolase (HD superfamily)